MMNILRLFTFLIVILLTSNEILVSQVIWDATTDIAATHFDNNHPRITTDRAGNPLVIWGKNSDLYFTRWNGSNFLAPAKLNGTLTIATQDWMGPDIASHGDTVYVVFKQTPEGELNSHVWCIRSLNGGVSFASPVQIENIGDSLSRFPTVTTDDEGNPIVAFMKFNNQFGDARWAVTRSEDFGSSFLPDVKASGWSGPSSDVCDCCPGTIEAEGDVVTMIYRDNNANNRDNWVGISYDGGKTFSGGFNVDQYNWMLQNCPASGPDGVIIGDTVYTTSMNGAVDDELVYFNKGSISELNANPALPVTEYSNGLIQNYPRMANYDRAVAMLWRHSLNFNSQLGIRFTSDITKGFPESFDTLAFSNVINADVAVTKDRVHVVWQDNGSGTVKYRSGEYEARTDTTAINAITWQQTTVFPNPGSKTLNLDVENTAAPYEVSLFDLQGNLALRKTNCFGKTELNIEGMIPGLYVGIVSGQNAYYRFMFMKN